MKELKIFLIILMIYFLMFSTQVYSQYDLHTCGMEQDLNETVTSHNFRGGRYKPHRSDLGGAPVNDHYFPALIVFVQFQSEQGDPNNTDLNYWPPGQPPNYMNSLITKFRQPNSSSWWNSYNGNEVCDIWHEFSRGNLHILGQAEHIILPLSEAEYRANLTPYKLMNKHIYDTLKQRLSGADWQFFDKWTCNGDGDFDWGADGLVDMIYKVHRTTLSGTLEYNAEGWAYLSEAEGQDGQGNYTVYNQGGVVVKINDYFYEKGSGVTITGRSSPASRDFFLEVMLHEVGHYLFGSGHIVYGSMAFGAGREFGFSPWEKIKLDFIHPKIVNFNQTNYTLGDYSTRYGTSSSEGEILLVNTATQGEYFLIANRRKVSDWDRRMAGDTVPHEKGFLKNINPEYGKGLYIYHTKNGFTYGGYNYDMECADGLWNWVQGGTASPGWDQNEVHPAFIRTTVSYNQDDPNLYNFNGKDGLSAFGTGYVNGIPKTLSSWYSIGKSHTYNPLTYGTDKIFTNTRDFWYSLEAYGDRWDAWNVGYNEVFSPYSSPNTKNWNSQQTGIFIWYKTLNSTNQEATLEIYKEGVNGTEEQILQWTPPSKPMTLEIESYWNGRTCNPKIVWKQNMEPDMVNTDEHSEMSWKRYKIYKSGNLNGLNYLPPDQMFYPEQKYQHVATVDFNPSTTDAFWIDPNVNLYDCSEAGETPGIPYPVRYRIQAVDKYNTSSVLSDFRSAVGVKDGSGEPIGDPEENPILNTGMNQTEIPDKYILKQNFPNPFNPTTNIQYELPVGNFVVLKVYDINGREIKTLVNEFKPAGRYLFSFNASDLSSGIYIYKIISGNFNETKRMVLIK